MAPKPACVPAADQVVDQSEQAEAQCGHEDHGADGCQRLADVERSEQDAAALDDDEGDRDHNPCRGRDTSASVVLPRQQRQLEHRLEEAAIDGTKVRASASRDSRPFARTSPLIFWRWNN